MASNKTGEVRTLSAYERAVRAFDALKPLEIEKGVVATPTVFSTGSFGWRYQKLIEVDGEEVMFGGNVVHPDSSKLMRRANGKDKKATEAQIAAARELVAAFQQIHAKLNARDNDDDADSKPKSKTSAMLGL